MPEPSGFAALVETEAAGRAREQGFTECFAHESFACVGQLAPQVRGQLRDRVAALAERALAMERRSEAWMEEALRDVRSAHRQAWAGRSARLTALAARAGGLITRIGPTCRWWWAPVTSTCTSGSRNRSWDISIQVVSSSCARTGPRSSGCSAPSRGSNPAHLRTPDQPAVRIRDLGPRALASVPPAGIAAHLEQFADIPDQATDEMFRAVLDILGLSRLTEKVRAVLSRALPLVVSLADVS